MKAQSRRGEDHSPRNQSEEPTKEISPKQGKLKYIVKLSCNKQLKKVQCNV
jgi:hypothetical protein